MHCPSPKRPSLQTPLPLQGVEHWDEVGDAMRPGHDMLQARPYLPAVHSSHAGDPDQNPKASSELEQMQSPVTGSHSPRVGPLQTRPEKAEMGHCLRHWGPPHPDWHFVQDDDDDNEVLLLFRQYPSVELEKQMQVGGDDEDEASQNPWPSHSEMTEVTPADDVKRFSPGHVLLHAGP